ncbi:MAG: MBL fold metallo-hydrolase [bacterium]|nr:MBL fold metallo-hydrolase [bacterium]
MKQLTKQLYGILTMGGFMNSYLLDTGDGLVVIDTGISPKHIAILEKGLSERGWGIIDIKHILITHCHYDHIGGLTTLQTKTHAPTYAHPADSPVIRGEQLPAFPNPDELGAINRFALNGMKNRKFPSARVDIEITDGQILSDIMPNLTVIHLPGHSNGQIGFWLPPEKLLIGGDVMMHIPLGFGLRMPSRAASPNWEEAKRSIKRVATMDVDAICLGHGRPIMQNAHEKINKLAQRL